MNRLLLIALLAFISACATPKERAKKKINKLINKHPELVDTVRTISRDTIINVDTVIFRQTELDTVFNVLLDSVFIIEEGKVKTEVRIVDREKIRVITKVQADTIIQVDTVFRVVERQLQIIDTRKTWKEYLKPFFYWILFFAFVIMFCLFLAKFAK